MNVAVNSFPDVGGFGQQRKPAWGLLSQMLHILLAKTRAETGAHKFMSVGRLLGGASGRETACRAVHILGIMVRNLLTPGSPDGGAAYLKASPLPPAPHGGRFDGLLAGWLSG